MLKDDHLVCDRCQTTITAIAHAPAEGWPAMHNLCSNCFLELWKASIPPA